MVTQKLLLILQAYFHHYSIIYFFHFINSTIFDYLDRFIENCFNLIFNLFHIVIIILTIPDAANSQLLMSDLILKLSPTFVVFIFNLQNAFTLPLFIYKLHFSDVSWLYHFAMMFIVIN